MTIKTIAVNKNLSKESAATDGTPKSSAPLRYPYAKIDEYDDYMRLEIVAFYSTRFSESRRFTSFKNQ